ncbi:hypothetical protein, partial [Robbsia andropogonis]|uniref:hypothetical protein n=1 Tax=Robbsia andropogonis TaxID=28092 RepID=UPI00209D41BE
MDPRSDDVVLGPHYRKTARSVGSAGRHGEGEHDRDEYRDARAPHRMSVGSSPALRASQSSIAPP